jgi:hypothetical protein
MSGLTSIKIKFFKKLASDKYPSFVLSYIFYSECRKNIPEEMAQGDYLTKIRLALQRHFY